MKNVAKEIKLVHPRTRIALPEVELRNRAKRTEVFGLHPVQEDRKAVRKAEAKPGHSPKL